MYNNFKYCLTPKELKEVRKYIIRDIESDNEVINPIENMTLQDYLDIIKEFMLGLCDENGVIIDPYSIGSNSVAIGYISEKRKVDTRTLSSKDVAEYWMDGRGLFTEHFNSQLWGDEKHQGNWDNIDQHDQNKWYHEDRLNDPLWFKECVMCIGHAGHPTETLMAGNLNPVQYEEDKWCMEFGVFSRSDYGCLKGYLHLKRKGIPVFIAKPEKYLTPKQLNTLKAKR